jgi:hypothetical protein
MVVTMSNKLKFIKRVIYKLKRSYGLPIDYYQISTHDLDVEDGDKITTYTKTRINRAIVLRAREFRSFVYDLAYISANKDFTTGAFFDPEDRKVIIDGGDVSVTFEPNIDDYFIYDGGSYGVKEIFHLELNYSYLMLARKLRGAPIIRTEDVFSTLNLGQSSESVLQDKLERSIISELNLTQNLVEVP